MMKRKLLTSVFLLLSMALVFPVWGHPQHEGDSLGEEDFLRRDPGQNFRQRDFRGDEDPYRPDRRKGRSGKKKKHQRMKMVRGAILRERVGLKEKQAKKVEAVFDRFTDDHQTSQKQVRQARKQLRNLINEESDDQKAYGQALEDLRAGMEAAEEVRTRQFRALEKLLEPREQATLILALEGVKKRMRQHKKQNRRQRRNRQEGSDFQERDF